MNEHAGPACALSGLIVGFFAVLLYDKIPPHAGPAPTAPAVASESRPVEPSISDRPAVIQQPAPVARSSPKVEQAGAKPSEVPQVQDREQVLKPSPSPAVRVEPAGTAARPPAPKAASPPSPRAPFVVVEAGETLADVAVRVYGSKDSAQVLWKANRDQVERVDSTLARGTLLRTP